MQLKPLSFVPPKLKLDQTLERLVHGKERSLWSTIVIVHGCHVVCDRPGVGGDLQTVPLLQDIGGRWRGPTVNT